MMFKKNAVALSLCRRRTATRLALLAAVVASLASYAADAGEPSVRMRRFALMAGFNDGGPSRAMLHFAGTDAQAMSKVLESLGGVSAEDLLLVQQPSRATFLGAFDRLSKLLATAPAGVRREVVVYYSGHSDEEGLLIGQDRVSYDELRARIQGLPADVRLAILDSCASGAFTMHKGGTRRAPFLLDTSVNTKGHAFLASSAINEVAQESNRIGASFFTHYLVSGLRGAADVNRDRRVTLQEAFQFASQETLAHTEKTRGGPQHAAYEFDLAGTSDLVVTDVRSTQATLALGNDLSGRIGVRDAAGNLVVELRKTGGNTIELGLEAGSYVVSMEGGGTRSEAEVVLALGQHADLARLAFHPGRPLEMAVARGDVQPGGEEGVAPPAQPPLRETAVQLALVPMSGDDQWDVHGFAFGFVGDRIGKLSSGLQLSLAVNLIDRELSGVQMTVGANIVRGPGHGLQLSVGGNYATGPYHGLQMATGLNIGRDEVHGAQLAAGLNLAAGKVSGLQMAAGANIASADSSGAQLAAGFNLASGSARGLQMAGALNMANDLHGAQIAPINLASNVSGLQFGVVNLASHASGFGFGVINIARQHDGETFGVINLIGNGIHSLAAYATESMLGNIELKLGSRHLYTSFQFAYQPGDEVTATPQQFQYKSRRYGLGFGVGYRQPLDLGRLRFVEIEASSLNIRDHFSSDAYGFGRSDGEPILASLRGLLGIEITSELSAIVGISANTAIAWGGRDLDIGPRYLQATQHSGKTTVREYPGIVLGLQM